MEIGGFYGRVIREDEMPQRFAVSRWHEFELPFEINVSDLEDNLLVGPDGMADERSRNAAATNQGKAAHGRE
jgi:hypothetical protein